MSITEIPPAKHDKESGIRGLIEIAGYVKNDFNAKETMTRYFNKLKNRMEKARTPLNSEEEEKIKNTLKDMKIYL